jgi:hypothetical protein
LRQRSRPEKDVNKWGSPKGLLLMASAPNPGGLNTVNSNIYQRNPEICPLLATELRCRLDDRDLKRRSNGAGQKVPSPHTAVAKSEHGVNMQACLAIVALRYVAEQTQHFALLIDGNRTVSLGSEVEPSSTARRR